VITAMQFTHSISVITAAMDGDLRQILASADRAFSGRELARIARVSSEGARRALARLVEQGMSSVRRLGRRTCTGSTGTTLPRR
jgi:DNA-binding transcriptional regulator YhcF (GntR family)